MANEAAQGGLQGSVLANRFTLARTLGHGGMGVVYAARVIETGQPVAIKVLQREFLHDAVVVDRFLEEARTCQRLVHPNILRVFETGRTEDNQPFLVMELLEGVPLSAYTKNGGKVPLAQAVPMLQAVLFGLSAAHAQGIVHRDLKPENVFLAREASGQFVVKILDFGIAKVMDAAGGMGKKTSTGMLLGTPAYMSPEQIKNSKDVDPRSDLFSLGVLFYEMLTGHPAFPAPTEFAKLTAVLTAEPEPIERIDPQLAFLAPFIALAIHKDRQQRFQSAAAMLHALASATGQDAGGNRPVQPLSHLPEVPSFTATARVAESPFVGSKDASGPREAVPVPAAPPVRISGPTISEARRRLLDQPISSSDTLASARGDQPPVREPPPQVVLVGPPSSGVESAASESRGVALWVVAALVTAALIAGFILGFAVARAM